MFAMSPTPETPQEKTPPPPPPAAPLDPKLQFVPRQVAATTTTETKSHLAPPEVDGEPKYGGATRFEAELEVNLFSSTNWIILIFVVRTKPCKSMVSQSLGL